MRRQWLLGSMLFVAGCIDFGEHRCDSDTQCGSSGSCILQDAGYGYCAQEDGTCDSGQRYVPEAGALGGGCVGAAGSSDTDPTTATQGSGSGASSGGIDACTDIDGDGFGEGNDCLGPDCDDGAAYSIDDCIYMSPSGSDNPDGTRTSPFARFPDAFALLDPTVGPYSVIMLAGTYTDDANTSVCLSSDEETCATPVADGMQDRRFRLVAETTGSVLLQGPPNLAAIRTQDVENWSFAGFSVGRPPGAAAANTVQLTDSRRLDFSGIVVAAGGGDAVAAIEVLGGQELEFTRCTVYSAEAPRGFHIWNSQDVTLDMCYGELQAPSASSTAAVYVFNNSSGIRLRDSIAVGSEASLRAQGDPGGTLNEVEGCIFLDGDSAIATRDGELKPRLRVHNTLLLPKGLDRFAVSIDSGRPFASLELDRVTLWATEPGFGFEDFDAGCDDDCSLSVIDSVLSTTDPLITISPADSGEADWAISLQNTATRSSAVDAPWAVRIGSAATPPRALPTCPIAPPTSGVFEGRGAQIVQRSDGSGPLWNSDGTFPCATEFNEISESACATVHLQLGLGDLACPPT